MANNSGMLSQSKHSTSVDKNEYYTLYNDIVEELNLYEAQFRGKRVICPCDWDESLEEICVFASEESVSNGTLFSRGTIKTIDVDATGKIEKDLGKVRCNFVKFLISHAEKWGIVSISVSGYNPSTGEGVRFQDVDYSKYDICVTNPPFSLFREFIETMLKNNMKFIIVGAQNSVTCKEVFLHFIRKEIWPGYHSHMSGFIRPDGTILPKQDNHARSCGWYTNMVVDYREKYLPIDEEYTPEKYPKYDNFDAINVDESMAIPCDYDGVMGVPPTFLHFYNPDQFEILGLSQIGCHDLVPDTKKYNDYKEYLRETDTPTGASGGKTNENAVLPGKGDKKTYYVGPNGEIVYPIYKRIFIRNKKVIKSI